MMLLDFFYWPRVFIILCFKAMRYWFFDFSTFFTRHHRQYRCLCLGSILGPFATIRCHFSIHLTFISLSINVVRVLQKSLQNVRGSGVIRAYSSIRFCFRLVFQIFAIFSCIYQTSIHSIRIPHICTSQTFSIASRIVICHFCIGEHEEHLPSHVNIVNFVENKKEAMIIVVDQSSNSLLYNAGDLGQHKDVLASRFDLTVIRSSGNQYYL